MTFGRLTFLGFLLWFLLAITKIVFIKVLDFDIFLIQIIFGFFVVVFSIACARRLGVINFLEAALACFYWFLITLVLDYFITIPIIGLPFFSRWAVWLGYGLMMLAVFFFHKKRHIEIRKQLHAHHHGHH